METPNQNAQMPPVKENHVMALLAYLGPLILIPILVSKKDPFVKFHIKQGLVLICIDVILWILTPMFFWPMFGIVQLINFAILVLVIIGIVNAVQGREKMLPVVGGLANYFKF